MSNILYHRTYKGPLAKCLGPKDTNYVMQEVYEGNYKNHLGDISLVQKLLTVGYYCPHMKRKEVYFVRTCKKCQRFARQLHQRVEILHLVIALWLFLK